MDPSMATFLKKSSAYQTIMYNADVRGNNNRLIQGVFGKVGNLYLVEADAFFGDTDSAASTFGFEFTEVEIAGLRKKDSAGKWTGQTGYDSTLAQTSRGLILGANAIQLGFGKMPDYRFQASEDFAIKSESCVEFWTEAQKTRLLAENQDYKQAVVSGIDNGIICVDLETQPAP